MDIQFNEEDFSHDALKAAKSIRQHFQNYFNKTHCQGRLTITSYMVPLGTTPERDIDILLLLEIAEGSQIPVSYGERKTDLVGGFIFNVEVKDHSSFTVSNRDIIVNYPNNRQHNASSQAQKVKNNLIHYLSVSRFSRCPLISDIVYLPNCSRETTLAIFGDTDSIPLNFWDYDFVPESILARSTKVFDGFHTFNNKENHTRIRDVREFLICRKSLPKDLGIKLDLLAKNTFEDVSKSILIGQDAIVTIMGAAGTGKTILMLNKALEMAGKGASSLFLTYNKQLVLDLDRLSSFLSQFSPRLPLAESLKRLRFETWDSFVTRIYGFYNYHQPMGIPAPSQTEKANRILTRYSINNGKEIFRIDEERKGNNIYKYSNVGFVFIDEAQDLPENIYLILKSLYSNNICLSLGLHQEHADPFQPEGATRIVLGDILRQKEIPSSITKKFLNVSGIKEDYRSIYPLPPQLTGGNALVFKGALNDQLYGRIFEWLMGYGLKPYDLLHLHVNQGDAKAPTDNPHYHGGIMTDKLNLKPEMFRYFHYESCRGLEASVLIYEEIDKYYDWCVEKFGETAAKRRVYIALSRVKEYAIFTFKDLNHWLYQSVVGQHSILREGFVWD